MPIDDPRAIELLHRTPYGRVSASQRALPFTTIARHLVVGDRIVLRLHRGHGYHHALDGSVATYEADNVHDGEPVAWSVQFTGTARLTDPGPAERARFGRAPRLADGDPFDPVFLGIEPEFARVHYLSDAPVFQYEHSV
ncbi:pyridoxamine 5'-phosphate oxidase family protein [Streptomyces sp. MST-110588]|uniref:pyridoxamine 5'-phosphate oxidase family protein n=1 Tax=Streptomyces sp. MST-110588 TaxID=2833628 RepID=UPI001F5C6769|nr:pyridoxamine 5'-phosphate oxidase family protein [Streptomyces sp. MST-110588]UNO41024.1 pyridoxamine 5'-phosphate oxidase family protein [Streptomyces sp. MST-110588]